MVLQRQAEEGLEDLRRIRDGELRDDFGLAVMDDGVDDLVDLHAQIRQPAMSEEGAGRGSGGNGRGREGHTLPVSTAVGSQRLKGAPGGELRRVLESVGDDIPVGEHHPAARSTTLPAFCSIRQPRERSSAIGRSARRCGRLGVASPIPLLQ